MEASKLTRLSTPLDGSLQLPGFSASCTIRTPIAVIVVAAAFTVYPVDGANGPVMVVHVCPACVHTILISSSSIVLLMLTLIVIVLPIAPVVLLMHSVLALHLSFVK